MAWFWLSFADPDRPAGTQFLGVAIVEAENLWHAGIVACRLGINPGGECRLWELPVELPEFSNRLLDADEVRLADKALGAAIAAISTKH